ncbi:hypothetical protein [Paraglaciecola sp.]|uniref:hypothetical protein n=1 Tax=Paraglaciecola sp. TaxID=1920173 RepID=UPI0030F4A02A
MQNELQYRFVDGQVANRFLNELSHWSSSTGHVQIKAKLARGANTVKVNYSFDGKGFDYTSSELDDLAAKYHGQEV